MLFSQSGQPRIVWNPKTNKTAAEFVKGEFETEDKDIQELLLSLGYEIGSRSDNTHEPEATVATGVFSTTAAARSRVVDASPESQRPTVAGASREGTAPGKTAQGSRAPARAGKKVPPRA